MLRRVSSPEFVGRADELAALEAAFARAQDGTPGAAFVAGESGVGKTRLLRELERRVSARGGRVLRGDCIAFGAGELPYAPIGAALRDLVRDLDESAFDEIIGPARGELARLVPELGGADGTAGDGGPGRSAIGEPLAQARLFGLLLGVLGRLGRDAPVLLAIEDLHWADRSTLEFLASLLRGVRDERLLLVCSYRSDEIHRRHPLRPFLAEEERRQIVARVHVGSFSRAELADQLAGILGGAPEPALVARVHERSEGNPFFAEELLAASDDGDAPLPASLRDALSVRLDVLSEDAHEVLRIAATAGRRVSHRLLETVADMGDADLLEGLREAVAHHVLVQDRDGYAFRHALLQEAVYADLLPGERAALHLALAEALAADPALADASAGTIAAELAQHWRAAHRLSEALAASVRAGLQAERVYAFVEAGRHFEAAIELWDSVQAAHDLAGMDRAAVVAHAAEAAHVSGDDHRAIATARHVLELVDPERDPVRSALAHERLGRYLWVGGDSDGSLAAYRQAVEILPPEPPTAELARVLASEGQILMLRGRMDEARERCARAVAIARALGARVVEGHALNTLGVTEVAIGAYAESERALRLALEIGVELSEADDISRAYVNLAEAIDQQGRVAEAAELTFEGARVAERLGSRSFVQFLEQEACWRVLRLGRFDEAAALVRRTAAQAPTGMSAVILANNAGHLGVRRGELDVAAAQFDRARELMGATTDSMWVGATWEGRAEVEAWRRRPEQAARYVAEAIDAIVESEEVVWYSARLYVVGIRAGADIAEQARALGEQGRAQDAERVGAGLSQRLGALLAPERWPAGPPPADCLAQQSVCDAELLRARGAPASDAWAAAATRFEDLGYPFELAYCRWRQAEALVLGGERSASAEPLREAAAIAAHLHAAGLAAEIAGLARRARVDLGDSAPSAPAPEGADVGGLGLTERERAVLELVAEGRTNREIGATLFMAEKTASVHVSRILAKLGVKSRVEAATAAHRLGLTAAQRQATAGAGNRPSRST